MDLWMPSENSIPMLLGIPTGVIDMLVGKLTKFETGWRLDYFLVSESIAYNVHDSYIVPAVTGGDHCPLRPVLEL
ncbi:hypothetical protein Peur_044188 [Populus x canadensis]